MSEQIKSILDICNLSTNMLISVTTDGAEIGTAAKIGNDRVLWIWCTVHLLSLIFEYSFNVFPIDLKEKKAVWLVKLRKIVNLFIIYFDKLKLYLPIPDDCKQVIFINLFKLIENQI